MTEYSAGYRSHNVATSHSGNRMIPRIADPASASRFLSDAECHDIMTRVNRFAKGGGYAQVYVESAWTGNARWARNQISTSGEVTTNDLTIRRIIRGAAATVSFDDTSDAGLSSALERAEHAVRFNPERPDEELWGWGEMFSKVSLDAGLSPPIFSTATDQLDDQHRAAAAQSLVRSAVEAGMLSAGYVEVSSRSRAMLDNAGHARYFRWTEAQYSVTVRDPAGTGSGWAGQDHHDWSKIDAPALSKTALDKCLTSRKPARVEPGRYTVILEPQAVCDLLAPLWSGGTIQAVSWSFSPFYKMMGSKIVDERITIGNDPMDPDLGSPPWGPLGVSEQLSDVVLAGAYYPITMVDRGVLVDLPYGREYATRTMHRQNGKGGASSFRVSGGTTSIDEMITSTERGLLVTRFDAPEVLDGKSMLMRGYTRDGLWLIEHGKISKPVMNMAFVDSPLFVLNKIDQLGVPRRAFLPHAGAIVPAIKAHDFSFTALSDAV